MVPKEGTFVAVTSGYYGNCALRDDGRLKCWGRVDGGSKPFKRFSAVHLSVFDVCAIRQDGRLKCWGRDLGGLSKVPDGMFVAVSSGDNYGCAIRTHGTLSCWGNGASEEWGTPPAGVFRSVSAAGIGMCGLRRGGEVECWAPPGKELLDHPEGEFVSVSVGGVHACGLRPDGRVECWGKDSRHGWASPPGPAVPFGACGEFSHLRDYAGVPDCLLGDDGIRTVGGYGWSSKQMRLSLAGVLYSLMRPGRFEQG